MLTHLLPLLTATLLSLTTITPPTLTTEQFESSQRTLATTPSEDLERFLQDLNRRKDVDYAAHHNAPGPNAPYLWSWIQSTATELTSRGYATDPDGTLYRPIPMR